jgi:hypothetical protein
MQHHNPDDKNIKSQITVTVMLPLTVLPCWYKGKAPTQPGLSTGKTDHLPALFSDPGANWSLCQNPVNEHHQYIQLYQPKQIEPHKNLQKAFYKTFNIILINENQTFCARSAENSNEIKLVIRYKPFFL